jgi:hypothetical protein
MLTLSTFWFTFISSAITLYLAWALSRNWRIVGVLIFCNIFEKTRYSLEESQCASLVVNSKSPLDGFFASVRLVWLGGPKGTLGKILGASFIILAINAAIPALLAAFPMYNTGMIASAECGMFTTGTINESNYWEIAGTITTNTIRWADAALALNASDRRGSNFKFPNSRGRAAASSTPLPVPSHSYVNECPDRAICNADLPFTFSSRYTLNPQHFGLNTKILFTLQVSDTCYRPVQAMAPLTSPSLPYTRYGLFYGPINLTNIGLTGGSEFTETVYEERKLSPGYTLTSHSARIGASGPIGSSWHPNASLILGGDPTILFYYLGSSTLPKRSSDPIFATRAIGLQTGIGVVYESAYIVSPIICNTQYMVCVDGGRRCSPLGGFVVVSNWLGGQRDEEWKDLSTFLSISLMDPPISLPAIASGAVGASKTAAAGGSVQIQFDPDSATTHRELLRLTQTGMIMLASGSRLAAAGYWRAAAGIMPTSIGSLCNNILIDSQNAISIFLVPYLVLLILATIIIAVSYAKHVGAGSNHLWRKWGDPWALYYVGQLHREVVEQLYGRFSVVDATEEWPTLRAGGGLGLEVVGESGSKRFAPGE